MHMKEILQFIKLSLSSENFFEKLDEFFYSHFNRSCSSMLELRKRTEKNKGELFEVFCLMYLQCKGYESWLLKDVPEDIAGALGLTKHDVGIDIVARVLQKSKKNGETQHIYFAVQCKYRSPTKDYKGRSVHRVTWKDVSTFLSLCTRTGPWVKHMIMTNALTVSWKGKKTPKDYTIARNTFKKQLNTFWCEMYYKFSSPVIQPSINIQPSTTQTTTQSSTNQREQRLAWLDKNFSQK